jgi:hypothetical protein
MPNVRNLVQSGLALLCVIMVAAGLLLTSQTAGEGVVLDRPGMPARLVEEDITATAFFEMAGDDLELTMLFSEPDEAGSVFRSRVRLIDGQRHTIVLGQDEEDGPTRFVFRRVGHTVEMRIEPTSTLTASLGLTG